jgi:transcription elongation factor SPT4
MSIVPEKFQKLRACMLCSLVKEQKTFSQDGCENCEQVLNYKVSQAIYTQVFYTFGICKFEGDSERVMECTSPTFEGVLAMMRPERSWTAKW